MHQLKVLSPKSFIINADFAKTVKPGSFEHFPLGYDKTSLMIRLRLQLLLLLHLEQFFS